MTITYPLTRKDAMKGISRSFAHRHPVWRFLTPGIGVVFLIASVLYFLSTKESHWMLGMMMLALGIIYLYLPFHRIKKAANNVFAGRTGEITVEMITSEKELTITTPDSSGTAAWSSFVDFRIHDDGILLYPQKAMHFWIPATAKIESGNWQDLEKIISEKVTPKL